MLVGQSGGRMVNLPWHLALRSTQINHYHQCFIQALFGEGRRNVPQGKLPKSQKYPMISRLCPWSR